MRETMRRNVPVPGNVNAERYPTLHQGDLNTNLRKSLGKAEAYGKSKNAPDRLKAAVTMSDIATTVIGTAVSGSHASQAGGSIDVLNAFYKATKKAELPANPFLEGSTYEGRHSPQTLSYLRQRAKKGIGTQILSLGGSAASAKTAGINVAGLTRHVSSFSTTVIHLIKLRQIAADRSGEEHERLVEWCDTVIRMKQIKMSRRGINTAVSAIPVGSIIGNIDNMITMGVNIGASFEGVATPMGVGQACYAAAAGLHWMAFDEHRFTLRQSDSQATRMIYELFQQRGLTRLFTRKYDVMGIIREPAGWLAIGDKLLMS